MGKANHRDAMRAAERAVTRLAPPKLSSGRDPFVFFLPISFGETALNPRLAAENAEKLLAAITRCPPPR